MSYDTRLVGDISGFFNNRRKPVTRMDRTAGNYPYYGAAGVQDFVAEYIFDGDYILVGEDGTVLEEGDYPVLQRVSGRFWVNNHAHVLKCETISDTNYLYYALKQRNIREYVTGAVQLKLNMGNLKSIPIPWPQSPKVREAIAKQLGLIDSLISMNKKITYSLEMVAQTIFKSWFVDFDPVRAKARGEKPVGMDDETAALFPDSFEDSEMGLIPRGWKIGKYENLGVIRQGKYLGPKDMISEWEDGYFPVEGATKTIGFTRKVSISKDLPAISCRGNCGIVRLVQAPAWISNNLMTINSSESHENFNYFLMLSDKFDDVISGSVQGQITLSSLSAKQCLLPDKRLISRFCEVADPFMKQIGLLKSQNKTLTELRDALLPKLISGELEIPEELS